MDPQVRFHVETKTGAGQGRVESALLEILRTHDLLDPDPVTAGAVVQSFYSQSLDVVNEMTDDGVPTALLTPGPGPDRPPLGVDIAAPDHRALLFDPEYIARMHDLGVEVHTWTVDDAETMSTLVEAGIDGIFTNRPDVLRGVLRDRFPELSTRSGNS